MLLDQAENLLLLIGGLSGVFCLLAVVATVADAYTRRKQ